jgi:hypothetical protein
MFSMCEFQSLFKKFIAQINRSVLRFKNFPFSLRGHNYKNNEFLWIIKPCFLLPSLRENGQFKVLYKTFFPAFET